MAARPDAAERGTVPADEARAPAVSARPHQPVIRIEDVVRTYVMGQAKVRALRESPA
jgi:hypothetical protein